MVRKIVGMFKPCDMEKFLGRDKKDVIMGPDDRAMIGFPTYFPIEWLIEDFNFTEEEARVFVDMVNTNETN